MLLVSLLDIRNNKSVDEDMGLASLSAIHEMEASFHLFDMCCIDLAAPGFHHVYPPPPSLSRQQPLPGRLAW